MSNRKGGAVADRLAYDVAVRGFRLIREDGGVVPCEAVRVAAKRAGCSERTMWRRINGEPAGRTLPPPLTELQLAYVRIARGNLQVAWEELRKAGLFRLGYRSFLRAFHGLDPALQAALTDGANAMRARLPYLELAKPSHFLEIVESDHALLEDARVYDPVTKRSGHPWVTVVLDVWSRMILGFSITLPTEDGSATSESVFLALADALLTYGKFEWMRYDQGADYMGPVADALERIGVATWPCPAYSPWTKPYVERFVNTLKANLLPRLAARGFELEKVA